MSSAIHATLTDIFRDVFDDETVVLHPGTTASDIDGWDSLAHIRLMLNVERTFKVKLTASEIGRLKTVGELIELLERKAAPG